MKSRKLLIGIILACAFALTLGLAGCGGGGASSDEGGASATADMPGTPTTIQYASFNMPDGWVDAEESDSYVAIEAKDDDGQVVKICSERLFEGDTLESKAAQRAEWNDSEVGEAFEMGSYTWLPVEFMWNDVPSCYYFAQIDDEHYTYVAAFETTAADEPVQTVLGTLSIALPEE